MVDGLIYGIGCVAFFLFFVADFFMAYTLRVIKLQHPAIDDNAPMPEVDDQAGSLATPTPSRTDNIETDLETDQKKAAVDVLSIPPMRFVFAAWATLALAVAGSIPTQRQFRIHHVHRYFIVIALCTPLLWLSQLLTSASTHSWNFFPVPKFIGYLFIVPGLFLSIYYVLRVVRLARQSECTQIQCLTAMWFRVDVMFGMVLVLLGGWGDWVVALCLFVVDAHVAYILNATCTNLLNAARRDHEHLPNPEAATAPSDRVEEIGTTTTAAVSIDNKDTR